MAEVTTLTNRVSIQWAQGPIESLAPLSVEGAGAVLTFLGVVRPYEDDRLLKGLSYTSYNPMAEQQLYRLAKRTIDLHQLSHVRIVHSLGFVGVNEPSLRIDVASKHRKEALSAMDGILNDLKRDVPIWKSPVYADESGDCQ